MRTNDFRKSSPRSEHSWQGKVTIIFGYPEHGWSQMPVTYSVFVQGVIVELSAVFDPFPDMIPWLEDIAEGNLPSYFIVDEEGKGKVFRASPVNKEEFLFESAEWILHEDEKKDLPFYIYIQVPKQQFLSEFLRRWDKLVNEKFDLDNWQESKIDLGKLDVTKIRRAAEK